MGMVLRVVPRDRLAITMLATAVEQSPTTDEPVYAGTAVGYLEQHSLRYDPEHPPLGKLFIATGLAFAGVHFDPAFTGDQAQLGRHVLYESGRAPARLSSVDEVSIRSCAGRPRRACRRCRRPHTCACTIRTSTGARTWAGSDRAWRRRTQASGFGWCTRAAECLRTTGSPRRTRWRFRRRRYTGCWAVSDSAVAKADGQLAALIGTSRPIDEVGHAITLYRRR